ncbi:flagellar export protein FliJ [Desnuesiella massiliensis]|uniref:flagellar export protein FliJ n=1 Tax=Desnuesiella massiliensis TaxID=1650662 RepID=UPI0006E1AF08|nr:flagellar export protein FliJ [Desnuesiella massiliensis]
MMGFNFKLQKLLDIRISKEDESKRVFKEAQQQKLKTEEKLNNLKENYNKYNVINKNETLIQQKIKKNYLNVINTSINETSKELEKKVFVLEQKREDLKRKQIDRKTVEILKEKKLDSFVKEQNRIEQINNDEFALYSYIRKTERR